MNDIITTIDGTDYEYMTFSDRLALNVDDTVAVRTGALTESYDLLTVTKKTKTQITLSDGERYVIRTGHKYGSHSTRPRYIAGRAVVEPTVEKMTEGTLGGAELAESVAQQIVADLTAKHGVNTARFDRIMQTEAAKNGTAIEPFGITMNVAAHTSITDVTEMTDDELKTRIDEANRVLYIESANLEIEREYNGKTRMGIKMCQSRIDSWTRAKQLFKNEIARRAEANRPQTPTEQLTVGEQVAVSAIVGVEDETLHTVAVVTDDYIEIDDEHRTRFDRETGREINAPLPRYIIVRDGTELPPLLALGDTVETVGQLHDLVVGSLVLDAEGTTYRLGFDERLKPSIIVQHYVGNTSTYGFETVKGSQTQLDGARVVFVPKK